MNTEPLYQPVVIPSSYEPYEPRATRPEFEPTAPPFEYQSMTILTGYQPRTTLTGYQLPACVICKYNGYPSQQRTFPCGCIHPIHDDCIILFKQTELPCPLCGTLWTLANRPRAIPQLAEHARPKRCTLWFTLFTIFIIVIAVCGTGVLVYLSVKNAF